MAAESKGFSSESTPTLASTPACLEWMTLCCSHVEHSYAKHLIAGQKLQAGGSSVTYVCLFLRHQAHHWHRCSNAMGPVMHLLLTRPGPGRTQTGSGDCSLHSITEPFLRSRLINGHKYLNARCITAVPLVWGVRVQIVSQLIKNYRKKLIPGPDQVPHFRHRGRDGSRSGISADCHVCYAEERSSVPTYHPASPSHKSGQKMLRMAISLNRE